MNDELIGILDQAIIDGQNPENHAAAVAKALKALQAHIDKAVKEARIDEQERYLKMLKTGKWRSFAIEVTDRIKELQDER